MCGQCDGKSKRQVQDEFRAMVDRHGWAVQFVDGDVENPAFGYTVGLTDFGHHEILVTGRTMRQTYDILQELALMVVAHHHVLEAGMVLELHSRPVCLLPMDRPADVLLTADAFYGRRLRALQAVWADDGGRFPWQQSPPDVLTQPMYGNPTTVL
jgi:hypothetical protein